MISVSLIGAGNVALHLYKVFSNAKDVRIVQWYNRNIKKISSYKNEVYVTDDINDLKASDIYILAISDDSIARVSSKLPFENEFVVHTSGSVNIHDLDKKNTRGVFYPLQTFSKSSEINFENVPMCIESEDKSKLELLKDLAESINSPIYKISTEQRQTLHLSAVFVNNFTNQLYRIAHEISDAQRINFEILKPLIKETANKIDELSPYMAQTGPAKRNDKKTIKRHLKQLDNVEHKKIYELMTQSIQKTHGISENQFKKTKK